MYKIQHCNFIFCSYLKIMFSMYKIQHCNWPRTSSVVVVVFFADIYAFYDLGGGGGGIFHPTNQSM